MSFQLPSGPVDPDVQQKMEDILKGMVTVFGILAVLAVGAGFVWLAMRGKDSH